jgi:hypothetical protein
MVTLQAAQAIRTTLEDDAQLGNYVGCEGVSIKLSLDLIAV